VQIVEEGFRTPEGQGPGALEHIPLQEDAQPWPVGGYGDLVVAYERFGQTLQGSGRVCKISIE
jgi:hypothetical protein